MMEVSCGVAAGLVGYEDILFSYPNQDTLLRQGLYVSLSANMVTF